jgi:hypothetical protein
MPPDDPAQKGGAVGAPAGGKPSTWQRLLDNKTGPQRLVISLGALAAAVIAIGGVATAVVRVFDGDGGGDSGLDRAPSQTQRVESGTLTQADSCQSCSITMTASSPSTIGSSAGSDLPT